MTMRDDYIAHFMSDDGGSLPQQDAETQADKCVSAIIRADAVDTGMENLKERNPSKFEELRKQSFEQQATYLGL